MQLERRMEGTKMIEQSGGIWREGKTPHPATLST